MSNYLIDVSIIAHSLLIHNTGTLEQRFFRAPQSGNTDVSYHQIGKIKKSPQGNNNEAGKEAGADCEHGFLFWK